MLTSHVSLYDNRLRKRLTYPSVMKDACLTQIELRKITILHDGRCIEGVSGTVQ